jgi:hypothetical protein
MASRASILKKIIEVLVFDSGQDGSPLLRQDLVARRR